MAYGGLGKPGLKKEKKGEIIKKLKKNLIFVKKMENNRLTQKHISYLTGFMHFKKGLDVTEISVEMTEFHSINKNFVKTTFS